MTPAWAVRNARQRNILSSGLTLHLPGEVGDFKHHIEMGEFQHHLAGNVIPGLALHIPTEQMQP